MALLERSGNMNVGLVLDRWQPHDTPALGFLFFSPCKESNLAVAASVAGASVPCGLYPVRVQALCFQEVFAGSGAMTQGWQNAGVRCMEPAEVYEEPHPAGPIAESTARSGRYLKMCDLPCWQRILARDDVQWVEFPMCAFGLGPEDEKGSTTTKHDWSSHGANLLAAPLPRCGVSPQAYPAERVAAWLHSYTLLHGGWSVCPQLRRGRGQCLDSSAVCRGRTCKPASQQVLAGAFDRAHGDGDAHGVQPSGSRLLSPQAHKPKFLKVLAFYHPKLKPGGAWLDRGSEERRGGRQASGSHLEHAGNALPLRCHCCVAAHLS